MFANFAATIDTKDKVAARLPASSGFEFLDCPQRVQHRRRGRLEALRPAAEGLRRRGRLLHRASRTRTSRTCSTTPPRSTTSRSGSPTPTSTCQSFAEWNATGNGDNVYVRMAFTPFEQADEQPGHPAVPRHRRGERRRHQPARRSRPRRRSCCGPRRPRRAAPSSPATACSTSCQEVTSWTGGGLHAETNPGGNMPPECAMLAQARRHQVGAGLARGGGRVRLRSRRYRRADAAGSSTRRELDENRISTAFQP